MDRKLELDRLVWSRQEQERMRDAVVVRYTAEVEQIGLGKTWNWAREVSGGRFWVKRGECCNLTEWLLL